MTKSEVTALQREINKEAVYQLTVDGIYGPKTATAYHWYIKQHTPRQIPTPVPPAPKPWWQSRTIWGLIATIVAGLAGRYGFEVDSEGLTNVLLQIIEAVGLALAFVGTIRRSAPVDGTLVAPGVRLPGGTAGVPSASQTDERNNNFLD